MFLKPLQMRLSARHINVLAGAAICAWFGAPAATREQTVPAPAVLRTFDRAPDTTALRRAALPGPYPAEVIRVLDGDTFEARVRVWFGQEITTLVRIRGIDAPELNGKCGDELRSAQASREALTAMLERGRPHLRDVSLDKYAGRVVASVSIAGSSDGGDVAATMIASGWARPYSGGRREAWCPLVSGPARN
jgi:endonuclease YncB( thermonuclease family)